VAEVRSILTHNESDNPKLAGRLKWMGAGGTVANLNASYTQNYSNGSNDEIRDLVVGVDRFRDFNSRYRGLYHEVGADLEVGSFWTNPSFTCPVTP